MLEAAEYPGKEGALMEVARHLGMPHNTLRNWYHDKHNPPPSELRRDKKKDLIIELEEVAHKLVRAIPGKIDEASLQQVATSMAIAIDKMQLLKGQPTWRGEVINLLKDGTITPEQVENELGPDLAKELFESIGLSVAGIREIEAASATIEESAESN